MSESYLLKNGRVIDPADKVDDNLDILVANGRIKKVGKDLTEKADSIIDAKGCIIAPGLIDMHAHLREPGREDEETILTGTRAAVKGGFASVVAMPNTEIAIDGPETVKMVKAIAKKEAIANVFIAGAITQARAGKSLAGIKGMKKEGIIAISDDGSSVDDDKLMLEALEEAKKYSIPVMAHCEDAALSAGGMINKGYMSTKMGLKGISKQSEYERAKRDIGLTKKAGSKIHIAHVSCKESVDIVRKAKSDGIDVTAETAPHYFSLTEECCAAYDTNTKMNPPLRTKEDVEAIKAGLKDGTIDAIATDHAPHTDSEKDVEFDFAPFGIIGLETALSLAVMELIENNLLSWPELIMKMSVNPSKILKLGRGSLSEGTIADIVVIDPRKEYIYKKDSIESKSRNSPFIDWKLKGKAIHLFVGGKLVMKDEVIMG